MQRDRWSSRTHRWCPPGSGDSLLGQPASGGDDPISEVGEGETWGTSLPFTLALDHIKS